MFPSISFLCMWTSGFMLSQNASSPLLLEPCRATSIKILLVLQQKVPFLKILCRFYQGKEFFCSCNDTFYKKNTAKFHLLQSYLHAKVNYKLIVSYIFLYFVLIYASHCFFLVLCCIDMDTVRPDTTRTRQQADA